jgi:hypothetical protein
MIGSRLLHDPGGLWDALPRDWVQYSLRLRSREQLEQAA